MNLNSQLELKHPFAGGYDGKRVLVTGHTGFKGAWLCEWLLALGAEVTGYSLPPPTDPSLFVQLGLETRMKSLTGDVRDAAALSAVVREGNFDFVFHLAAQPLVRLSYAEPVETYATNVMGTVHLLEAVRKSGHPCSVVVVTTDKCYENREWLHGYREEDPLGGRDPYSSSKGAAELVVAAYRQSFFTLAGKPGTQEGVHLASARAGNVIGGGDWALDRIVPDCIRSLATGAAIPVRNKVATRPWQHVLEPLSGYLWLGAAMAGVKSHKLPLASERYAQAFNFGPGLESNKTVADLVQEILLHWPGAWDDRCDPNAPHEAKLLNLATDKARHLLGWFPVWDFETTVAQTVSWYREVSKDSAAAGILTRTQITDYVRQAQTMGLAWACDEASPATLKT